MSLSPLSIVINGVDQFSSTFNQMNKKLNKTADNFKKVGGNLTKYVTAPIMGVGLASAKMALDLNSGMANVATLIPGNLEHINNLKAGVQDLAISVGKDTGDIADGLYQVVSAFGDNAETMQRLEITARAAAAGGATTTDALNLLSAVTKGYGDTSAKAMQDASDLSFLVVKLGQTDFPQLASAIGKAVPTAKSLNISQQELFATYATLTGVTGTASEVTTQLTSIMSAMLKPSDALDKTVKSLGYSSASLMMKEKGLVGTLQELNKVTKGDADAMAMLLGRKEALTAALALTGSQADVFSDKLGQMMKAGGATNTAFNEVNNGINSTGAAFAAAKVRITVSLQKIGDKLLPFAALALEKLNPLLDVIDSIGPALTGTGIAFMGAIAAAGPLLVVAGSMISAFTAISAQVAAAGGIIALLTNPIGIAIAAIVGITAVVIALWDQMLPLRMIIVDTGSQLKSLLMPAIMGVGTALGTLWSIYQKLFLIMQPVYILVFKMAKLFVAPWVTALAYAFRGLLAVLNPVLSFLDLILGKVVGFVDTVSKLFGIINKEGKSANEALDTKGIANKVGSDITMPVSPMDGMDFSKFGLGEKAPDLGKAFPVMQKEDSIVTLDFKNVPSGVQVTKESGRVKLNSDNGLIMEEA